MSNFLKRARVRNLIKRFSLESIADGQKRQELEYTFYGKLDDLSVLETDAVSKKEEQEQYTIPLDSDHVGIRIRRINVTNFVMTTKAKRDGVKGKEEVEQEISEDMFNLLRETATSGFRKTRYFIPIEGTDLTWEIDVFKDQVEQVHSWIKLDLEVDSPDTQLPELPFPLTESILSQGDRKTEEEEDFIDTLWQKEWNVMVEIPPVTGSDDSQQEKEEEVEEDEDKEEEDIPDNEDTDTDDDIDYSLSNT